jgi:penicillin-binding protein 1B
LAAGCGGHANVSGLDADAQACYSSSSFNTPVPRARHPYRRPRRRWLRFAAALLTGPLLVLAGIGVYLYQTVAMDVDARLTGLHDRVAPRVFARRFAVRVGQWLTPGELAARLDDLGYARRRQVQEPGEFAVSGATVSFIPRAGQAQDRLVAVRLAVDEKAGTGRVVSLEVERAGALAEIELEAPLLAGMAAGERGRQRQVPLAHLPAHVVQAVLAIEDRRFYTHPGVDVIRTAGAVMTNIRGDRPYLVGGSTLTQQLVKNSFLTPEKLYTRKIREQVMSVILERRLTKDQILELYLNDIYLGQRGSFAVHGMAEGARLFFGKDITNVTLAEAATLAGIIQSPAVYSPVRNADRATARRNVVLQTMVEAGYIDQAMAREAAAESLVTSAGSVDAEAPYFVDYVTHLTADQVTLRASNTAIDVHTTLDLHLQRLAQEAVSQGIADLEQQLASRRRQRGPLQAVLVAADPRTGDILALVGGRSYQRSQFNRATSAKRQPGSTFKPFVFLAAFEEALRSGRTDLSPATVVEDEPATFFFNEQEWTPRNYDGEYDGPITARRALARSRNLATIQMAERTGYDHIAAMWRSIGGDLATRAYPSITLGVFEATPLEIAEAYTVFPNLGEVRPLRALSAVMVNGQSLPLAQPRTRRVSAPAPAFLVTSMLRSVMNEGTGAGARRRGFTLDAAGKSGTTNDLRDAWFVGYTPELLTVVWVGLDDNTPVGLSGSQAALPIWSTFMTRALAGHRSQAFPVPEGVTFAEVDKDTGELAGPFCDQRHSEAFLTGTAPVSVCRLHHGLPPSDTLPSLPWFVTPTSVPGGPPPATPSAATSQFGAHLGDPSGPRPAASGPP